MECSYESSVFHQTPLQFHFPHNYRLYGQVDVCEGPVLIRRQRTDDRRQRTEDRGQRSEVRGQRSEIRGQTTDDRGRKTEDRRQHAALRQAQDRRAASSVQKTISAPESPVGASFACDLNGFNGFNEFNDFPCALRPVPCA